MLPSLNLALELPHEMKLRFGAAITVARPRLDDLGGGSSYTVTSDQGSSAQLQRAALTTGHAMAVAIRSSSPGRRTPSTCRSRNTSATKAYVSLAAYYKDLKTYIFNQSTGRRLLGRAAAAGGAG